MHRPARHAPTDAERPQITLADSIDFLACDGNNSCSSSRRIWPTYNVVVPDILTIPGHPPSEHLSPFSGKLYYHRHSPRLGQGNYSDPIAERNGLSVYLSASISQKPHVRSSPVMCMPPLVVARRFSSGGIGIRYVLAVSCMTSYLYTYRWGMSLPLQRVASLRRRAQANAPAVACWLRHVLDDGGRPD